MEEKVVMQLNTFLTKLGFPETITTLRTSDRLSHSKENGTKLRVGGGNRLVLVGRGKFMVGDPRYSTVVFEETLLDTNPAVKELHQRGWIQKYGVSSEGVLVIPPSEVRGRPTYITRGKVGGVVTWLIVPREEKKVVTHPAATTQGRIFMPASA